MDRIRALSVFVAVAEAGSFAAAGRKLGLSPPSVTRAIATIEDRLGARLLHRTTRSVRLTQTGHRYLTDCRRILAELEDADRLAAGLHAEPGGRVVVTAPVLFGRMIVAPALLTTLDAYPRISISTLFVDRVVHLLDEGPDVAVRIAHLPDSSLTAVRVGSVRRIICAAPGYLADRGQPLDPDDLADHDVIKFSSSAPDTDWMLQRGGKPLPVRVKSRLHCNIADVAINAALAGRGITRVLSYQVASHIASGQLEVILQDFEPDPIPVHVVHKETGHVSARVRAVVDHLAGSLRGHPALG